MVGIASGNTEICQAFDEFGANPDLEEIRYNMKRWLNRTACATNVVLMKQTSNTSDSDCPCLPPCQEQSYRYSLISLLQPALL